MANTRPHTLICDYLQALGVPHTETYSNKRFGQMPFQTMFGLSKLLEEYGVKSEGYNLPDKGEIMKITPPFLARVGGQYVIVENLSDDEIHYKTQGVSETVPSGEFFAAWDGNVFLSYPSADAMEPEYGVHRRMEFLMRSKKWILIACVCCIMLYLFVSDGLWRNVSTVLLTCVDIAGLYFTYLLVQKSLNIHNSAADRVCGVLQAGGCDSILSLKASKFFGLFGWSEVGFSYFSVSLLTMLMFPSMLPSLALCNLCCLPFTFWSIWYQRFRAHKWCTLCVCVQASLWLLFFCYCFGGWLKISWPPTREFVVLGMSYVAVMLGINALMPYIEQDTDVASR